MNETLPVECNKWIEQNLIHADPNPQKCNGKLLEDFLGRNPNLILLNNESICKGKITRTRKIMNEEEKSILDITIVSEDLLDDITEMIIDENKEYPLTNFINAASKNNS